MPVPKGTLITVKECVRANNNRTCLSVMKRLWTPLYSKYGPHVVSRKRRRGHCGVTGSRRKNLDSIVVHLRGVACGLCLPPAHHPTPAPPLPTTPTPIQSLFLAGAGETECKHVWLQATEEQRPRSHRAVGSTMKDLPSGDPRGSDRDGGCGPLHLEGSVGSSQVTEMGPIPFPALLQPPPGQGSSGGRLTAKHRGLEVRSLKTSFQTSSQITAALLSSFQLAVSIAVEVSVRQPL
ncbi:unnamed protein product [Merluccius merluccius]